MHPRPHGPGIGLQALLAIPGSLLALATSYVYGARSDRANGIVRH
jgi:hypothetical protein